MVRKASSQVQGQLPQPGDTVSVIASMNGKSILAEVDSITRSNMVVVLPGHVRLKLYKHETKPMYVGNQAGMEFVVNI